MLDASTAGFCRLLGRGFVSRDDWYRSIPTILCRVGEAGLDAHALTLFDFLDLPPATRALFPYAKLRASRRHGALQVDEATLEQLQRIYGALDAVVARLPEKGLWLRNTAVPRARAR